MAGGGGRIADVLVPTIRFRQPDTKENAVTRATTVLRLAPKCPMCQDVHTFNFKRHAEIKFPPSWLNSCQKFRDLDPKRKAAVMEEHSGCLICTFFTHMRDRCYQKRDRSSADTCGEMEGNKGCGCKHQPHAAPVQEQVLPGNFSMHGGHS